MLPKPFRVLMKLLFLKVSGVRIPRKYIYLLHPNVCMDRKARNAAGKAYAFFDCKAPRKEIEGELPTIRKFAKVPPLVELSLTEGPEALEGDARIKEIAANFKALGMRWTISATYPRATNEAAADELKAVS